MFELSKHSICLGSSERRKSTFICAMILFACLSGSTIFICLKRSILKYFAFLSDKSKMCFLSPNLGTVTFKSSPKSTLKGTYISLELELKRCLISVMASCNNCKSVSSNFFFISKVCERIIEPYDNCKKLT